jgi:hypothetical protein
VDWNYVIAEGFQNKEKSKTNPFGVSHEELVTHVGSAHDPEEHKADCIAEGKTTTADPKTSTPTATPDPAVPDLGLPQQGSALPQKLKQKYGPKLGRSLDEVNIISAPAHVKYLGAKAFTWGKNIYTGTETTDKHIRHEIGHFHPKDKATRKIRRWAKSDNWAARQAAITAERRRKEAIRRRIEAERRRKLAEAIARKRREAARRAALAAARRKKAKLAAKSKPRLRTNQNLLKGKVIRTKQQNQLQQQKQQHAQALRNTPGMQQILGQSSFFKGALTLGKGAFSGAKTTASRTTQNKPEAAPKKEESLFGGALNLGKSALSGVASMGTAVLNGKGLSTIAKQIPTSLLRVSTPGLLAATVLPGATTTATLPQIQTAPHPQQPKKEDGGWFGKALNFGGSLVDKAKDFGKNAMNGIASVGNNVANTARNAWNGAANWVDKHKAEIAIGVGVVALAAATIVTGGAALAVGGALLGGASVSGGTVALALAGGAIAGGGMTLAREGADIKKGVVDPATGQKKTDINFKNVGLGAAFGAVTAPLGGAAFKAAPTLVGGLGLIAGSRSGINAYNNITGNNFLTNNNPERTKNGWSAALDIGETGMALSPLAFKGGRNALFGQQARSQTLQTGKSIWNGAGNLASRTWNGIKPPGQAFNGARNMATQAFNGAKSLPKQMLNGAKNWGAQAWNGTKNFKGIITGADGLSPIDPLLAHGSKGGILRNVAAWRMNNFRRNSTTFYSVQGPEDAARLSAGGTPWPIAPNRAHMGPGLYSWGSRERATNYFNMLSKNADNLKIMPFRISNKNLNNLNKLDLRPPMSDDAANTWLGKHSSLYGEGIPHAYDYIIRGTNIGDEHYFSTNAFHLFR